MAEHEYHSGGEGIVLLDASDFCVNDASLTISVTDVPTTTTCDFDTVSGFLYANRVGVTRSAEGTLKYFWDATNPPLSLLPGTFVALDIKFPGAVHFTAAKILIVTMPLSLPLEGIYGWEVSWKSKGLFTLA